MSIVSEFKAFALKGNMIDIAVGLVIGAAFGKIVTSLVADVITPSLGMLVGGVDVSHLAVVLRAAAGDRPAVVVSYGLFIQSMIDFVIIAFAIFLGVKGINRLRREEETAPAVPTKDQQLLEEIRNLLQAQQHEQQA